MKKLKSTSVIFLLLAAMMTTAFADDGEPTTCDFYDSKELKIENPKKLLIKNPNKVTSTYYSAYYNAVAELFTKIAATCTAKGARSLAAKYTAAASTCKLKKIDCLNSYDNFVQNKEDFKNTISTADWCGYIGAGKPTVKPSDSTKTHSDLVEAINYCARSASYAYYKILTNASSNLCTVMIDGQKWHDRNPKKECTDITDKLYQPKPRWY